MRIIAIWHTKGGVGKSTIAVNLGLALHKMGKKVLLVDSDTQETTLHLSKRFKEPKAISYCQFDKRKARKYDYVIVDMFGLDIRQFPDLFEKVVVPMLSGTHGVIMPWPISYLTEDKKLSEKIASVLKDHNIRLLGVVFNKARHYTNDRRALANYKINMGDMSFKTTIRESKYADTGVIMLDNPKSDIAKDFEKLADEFVERVR